MSEEKELICSYDIDGVLYNGPGMPAMRPGRNVDVIVTGRSVDEKEETKDYLHSRGIYNVVFMNPTPFDKKTREGSGLHKASVINDINGHNKFFTIAIHYEDDPVQAAVIRKRCPGVTVIELSNPLVELSNRRNLDWDKE